MYNDFLPSVRSHFYGSFGPHNNASSPRPVRFLDTVVSVYRTSRRKIRSLDDLDQIFYVDILIIDIGTYRIYNVIEVVGSHIRCHTDSNT